MRSLILRFASRLQFPVLFLITGALFLVDLVIPDLVPLADELLLGLLTLLFGSWRKRRGERAPETAGASKPDDDDEVIDIEVEVEKS